MNHYEEHYEKWYDEQRKRNQQDKTMSTKTKGRGKDGGGTKKK